MSEETTRVPPASPWNKTKSVGSASPKTDATRVRSASPRTETTRVRSASPKNDSARVRSASPRIETAPVRSASPGTETKRVRPASPRTETAPVRSASPRTETKRVRPASPRTETAPVRSASPSTETKRVRPASPRTKLRGDDSIRSFEISPGSLTSNGKTIPNYLRPSTGSCHDLCKHGTRHEHANDVKESRPWRKSIEGNSADSMPTKEYKALTGTKKTGVVKQKPSADPKIQPPSGETVARCEQVDVPSEQTSSDTRAIVSDEFTSGGTETSSTGGNEKQEISEPSDNVKVTEKVTSLDAKSLKCFEKSSRSPSPISKGASAERNIVGRKNVDRRMSLDGRKPFEGRKSPDQIGRGLEMRKSLDGKKNIGMRTGNNADDKILPVTKDSENGTSFNPETNKKDGSLGNSKNDTESELLKKHAAASKPKIVKMKPLPSKYPSALKPLSPVHPFSVVRSSKTDDNQLPGKNTTSRVDAKKVGTATKYPSSRSSVNKEEITSTKKVGFIKLVSSARRDSKVTAVKENNRNEQDAQEDTAGSIKIPSEKNSTASTKVKSKSSITLLPPVLAVSKTTIRSGTSYKPPHLKKIPVGPQSKNTEKGPSGLRKGKTTVNMESENHGPSKPKVRKNSLPNETTHINKPSLRTRNVPVRGRDTVKNSNSNSSGRYLFKYPSIGRKKNTQVLFNKVIEETAKRLVRTKKSNVLALVGAFETVISIQKKSSAAAARPKAKKISSFKKHPR